MREIKFQFIYKGVPFSVKNQKRNWFKKSYHLDELIEKPLSQICDVHDQAELVAKRQYAGLKDKNGVEIYEGDIIKVRYFPLGANKEVIEYYNLVEVLSFRKVKHKISGTKIIDESRALSHHATKTKKYRHPSAGYDWVSDLNVYAIRNMEVIGNIYENSELLEE